MTSWLDLFHRHLEGCATCDLHPFDLCGKGAALMRASAAVITLGTGTAPDRADPVFSQTIRRTTHPPKEPEMSKETDGGEGLQRVRIPLGSPSQPTNETEGNTDRTELRSDATAENRPETRRPAPGDKVELYINAGVGWSTVPREVTAVDGDWFVVDGRPFDPLAIRQEGTLWRWPEGTTHCPDAVPAAVPSLEFDPRLCAHCGQLVAKGGGSEQPGGKLAHVGCQPQQPEPRRCTAPITDAGAAGEIVEQCGAVLGRDVHCDVCGDAGGAHRCYQHCAGVDHFKGNVIEQGGPFGLRWKIVEIATSRFRGQVVRRHDGEVTIIATAHGVTVEETKATLHLHLRQAETIPRGQHTWHGPEATPPAPGLTPAHAAVGFVERVPPPGKMGAALRAVLLEEVIEWLRGCEKQWERLAYDLPETADRAKELHDRQIVELFSRLAGAL